MKTKRLLPSLKWSIFWIAVHSISVWIMSLLLFRVSNQLLYILLSGFGIALIAKTVRTQTRHEKIRFNGAFLLWICLTCFSFWVVRSLLLFVNISGNILYFVFMGLGIYLISHVFSRILKKVPIKTPQKAEIIKKSITKPIFKQKPGEIFLISDTHFGHRNIIRYCNRPFRNTRSMDHTIRKRWNKSVNKNDSVYFLGDFVFRGSIGYWINKLNGRKKFIRGNHDDKLKHAIPYKILNHNGYRFYLVHDPSDVPGDWNDWIIHGHVHNNNTSLFPFIEGARKRINVSVELIDYRPVSLDHILSLNLSDIKRMRTIKSKIEYW
jgi:calcineurin-like phosphoesterase family protein